MRKPRIIFFDIDGTEPDLDDYFAVAKSTVPVSPDFDAMAFGAENGLISSITANKKAPAGPSAVLQKPPGGCCRFRFSKKVQQELPPQRSITFCTAAVTRSPMGCSGTPTM